MGFERSGEVGIPVIDISTRNTHAPEQLLDAAARYGFVFIENDDTVIPSRAINHMFDLSKKFFASPLEIKEAVSLSSNSAGKNHGWLSRGVEKLDPATQKRPDVKEAFNIGSPINSQHLQQPLPKPLQSHERTIIDFQNSCRELCQQVLQHFATALDIDKDWFTSRHDESKGPSGTVFRLLYYPQIDNAEEDVDIRAGAHSDYGSVTLLFQQVGQPGLEIKTPSGEWAAVPVDPSSTTAEDEKNDELNGKNLPILLNIGDLLEDWTAGLLKSTVHRVIFPKGPKGGDRYSMAYFCHPLDDALLEPVPSKLVEERTEGRQVNGRNGHVLTAKDHLMERLAATYKVK